MFRPSFETLEKREVFSANPLAIPPALAGDVPHPAGVHVEEIAGFKSVTRPFVDGLAARASAGTDSQNAGPNVVGPDLGDFQGNLLAGTYGRGAADFDNDSDVDSSDFLRRHEGADPAANANPIHPASPRGFVDDLLGWDFILPYIEQDNLYKFAGNRAAGGAAQLVASDEYFWRLGSDGTRVASTASAIQLDFDDSGNVLGVYCSSDFWGHLRTRHDTVKNSISN